MNRPKHGYVYGWVEIDDRNGDVWFYDFDGNKMLLHGDTSTDDEPGYYHGQNLIILFDGDPHPKQILGDRLGGGWEVASHLIMSRGSASIPEGGVQ